MKTGRSITIRDLHARTGEQVRRAAQSRLPVPVTDRGKLVAVLAAPHLLAPRPRRRSLLPEYAALLSQAATNDVLEDLDAIRGDR